MARAAQRYGIIVRDKSGSVTFYGEAPKSGDPWKSIYGGRQPSYFVDRFPWDKLQLVNNERELRLTSVNIDPTRLGVRPLTNP